MTWNYTYTPLVWPSFLTAVLLIGLSIFSGRRRRFPGALPFIIGCLFAALWAAGAAMETMAVDVLTKIFWIKFQAIWQLPAVTAETCFILEYVWPGRWLTRRNLILLSLAPLLLLALVQTNDLHHWMWSSFTAGGALIPLPGPGVWFYVAYASVLGLIEIIVFVWLFLRAAQHRWPVSVFALGQIIAHIIYGLGMTVAPNNYLPSDLFVVTSVFLMYAIVLFGFRILDPIPLARQTVIVQMREGMLVLDLQGRVAGLNPAAQDILGMPANNVIGRPIQELLPVVPDAHGDCLTAGADQIEIRLGVEPEIRYYLLETSALKDWRGMAIGRLLLFCDVTEHKQAQEQIVQQQRAQAMLQEREQLSRELHDCLGQVFAFVNTQGQTVHRLLGRGDIERADEYVCRLVEVTREADVDIRESILGLRETISETGLLPALTHYLKQYEKNYGIHTELRVPESFSDGAFEPLVEVQLLRILQETLTNVRKHARARSVWITFAVENDCESKPCAHNPCARITVQDDGRGFEPGFSSPRSGEHVGLRVMRERVEELGGNLSLHSEAGQGTQVVVRVPMKEGSHVDVGKERFGEVPMSSLAEVERG